MNPHEHDDERWVERVRGSEPPLDVDEALLLPALRAAIFAAAQRREAAQTEAGLQRLLARLEAQGLIEPAGDETQRWVEVVQGRRAADDEIEAALAPALRQAIEAAAAARGEAALLAKLERAGLLQPADSVAATDTGSAAHGAAAIAAGGAGSPGVASVPAQTSAAASSAHRVDESLRRRHAANRPWFAAAFAAAAVALIAVLSLVFYLRPPLAVNQPGNVTMRGGIEHVAMLRAADPAARAAQVQRELRALGFSVQVTEKGAVHIVDVVVPERGLAAYQVWLQRSVSPAQRVTVAGDYRVVVQPESAP